MELAIRAKGMLLMREAGFAVAVESEVTEQLNELKYLETSIGRTGLLAMSPLVRTTSRDLWQLYMLGRK